MFDPCGELSVCASVRSAVLDRFRRRHGMWGGWVKFVTPCVVAVLLEEKN